MPRLVRSHLAAISILLAAGICSLVNGCNGSPAESENAKVPTGINQSTDATSAIAAKDDLTVASEKFRDGDFDAAADAAYRALVTDPNDSEASFLTAQIESARGNHGVVADLTAAIHVGSRRGKKALDLRVRSLVQLSRLDEAADALIAGLQADPDLIAWRHNAWRLLTRIGRREEASDQAHLLCLLGQANTQELLSLIRRNDAFPAVLADGDDPAKYFEPGLGMARWYFTQEKYRRALEELASQYETTFQSSAACQLYGRLLAETQAFEEIPRWHTKCGDDAKNHSDYWAALGTFFFDQRQYEASARALLTAVQRNPTDRFSTQRLAKVFDALERPEDGAQFRHRGIEMYKVERDAKALTLSPADTGTRQRMTRRVMELGHPFQALQWTLLSLPVQAQQQKAIVNQQRNALLQSQ
ncbi:MAG: hypothetical protein HKN47_06470, partial [Pirellulaceae bacterium]|nr:hypothetical protein [Pirellulaceae bacterium]